MVVLRVCRALNDTLTIEKLNSGTYSLEMRPMQLGPLLQHVVASLQPSARALGIHLAVTSLAPAEWVLGDPHRLTQVLSNFVSNAIKFVDHSGNGRVLLEAAVLPSPPTQRPTGVNPPMPLDTATAATTSGGTAGQLPAACVPASRNSDNHSVAMCPHADDAATCSIEDLSPIPDREAPSALSVATAEEGGYQVHDGPTHRHPMPPLEARETGRETSARRHPLGAPCGLCGSRPV